MLVLAMLAHLAACASTSASQSEKGVVNLAQDPECKELGVQPSTRISRFERTMLRAYSKASGACGLVERLGLPGSLECKRRFLLAFAAAAKRHRTGKLAGEMLAHYLTEPSKRKGFRGNDAQTELYLSYDELEAATDDLRAIGDLFALRARSAAAYAKNYPRPDVLFRSQVMMGRPYLPHGPNARPYRLALHRMTPSFGAVVVPSSSPDTRAFDLYRSAYDVYDWRVGQHGAGEENAIFRAAGEGGTCYKVSIPAAPMQEMEALGMAHPFRVVFRKAPERVEVAIEQGGGDPRRRQEG